MELSLFLSYYYTILFYQSGQREITQGSMWKQSDLDTSVLKQLKCTLIHLFIIRNSMKLVESSSLLRLTLSTDVQICPQEHNIH